MNGSLFNTFGLVVLVATFLVVTGAIVTFVLVVRRTRRRASREASGTVGDTR